MSSKPNKSFDHEEKLNMNSELFPEDQDWEIWACQIADEVEKQILTGSNQTIAFHDGKDCENEK